ncbi:LAMI_0G16776g1_1 [Lachancea mirantina]|uniref:LAMI_0G16776g1_1 n=1 Tax=Lachancea mirantina TaxID=1230905 RepID=A0A1G4KCV1_9SACH|nr:LAMI_0G16776g1_1 [Lachancea mirantina]
MRGFHAVARKIRSVFVLSATALVLFYYMFQNEINKLNSYAETESLPHITGNANDALVAHSSFELADKNRFFPLLQDVPEQEQSQDGARNGETGGATATAAAAAAAAAADASANGASNDKELYPVRYENGLKPGYWRATRGAGSDRVQSDVFGTVATATGQHRDRVRDTFAKSWNWFYRNREKYSGPEAAAVAAASMEPLYMLGLPAVLIKQALGVVEASHQSVFRVQTVDVAGTANCMLSGLLSAYELSQGSDERMQARLLELATSTADFLLRAFDTPNRMPILPFPAHSALTNRFPFRHTEVGQLGALSLAFTKLSQITKNDKYFDAIYRIYRVAELSKHEFDIDYLLPTAVDASGCSMLAPEKVESGDHLRGSKVMKSIHNGKYVHCLQTGKFRSIDAQPQLFALDARALPFYHNLVNFHFLLNQHDIFEHNELTAYLVNALDRISTLLVYKPLLPNAEDQEFAFVSSATTTSHFDTLSNQDIVDVAQNHDMHQTSCATASMLALAGKLFRNDTLSSQAAAIASACAHLSGLLGVMPEALVVDKCSNEPCDYNRRHYKTDTDKPLLDQNLPSVKLTGETSSDTKKPAKAYTLRDGAVHAALEDKSYEWIEVQENMQAPYLHAVDPHYHLSSEAIEAVFFQYRITGDQIWQKRGMKMFDAMMSKITSTQAKGVSEISPLDNLFSIVFSQSPPPPHWFTKTLKFYYLLFSDTPASYSLDDFVFASSGQTFRRKTIYDEGLQEEPAVTYAALLSPLHFLKKV